MREFYIPFDFEGIEKDVHVKFKCVFHVPIIIGPTRKTPSKIYNILICINWRILLASSI